MELKNKTNRSAADIRAEIECLQQELTQAIIEEKRNTYNGTFPTTLYTWDMYVDEDEKGTWCGAEKDGIDWNGYVYETEDDAVTGGLDLLMQLNNEGDLDYDVDDYTVDTIAIPFKELTAEILEYSDLEHLIPPII